MILKEVLVVFGINIDLLFLLMVIIILLFLFQPYFLSNFVSLINLFMFLIFHLWWVSLLPLLVLLILLLKTPEYVPAVYLMLWHFFTNWLMSVQSFLFFVPVKLLSLLLYVFENLNARTSQTLRYSTWLVIVFSVWMCSSVSYPPINPACSLGWIVSKIIRRLLEEDWLICSCLGLLCFQWKSK